MEDPGSSPSQRRPLFQFGLRDFALVVVVVSVTLFCFKAPSLRGARETGRQLDVAIVGRGYFQVCDRESGSIYYSRCGQLSINPNGELMVGSVADGWMLEPQITLPSDWTSIDIDKHGVVSVLQSDNFQLTQLGQIQLASFINDEGMREVLPNIYAESEFTGNATLTNPGHEGTGFLQQGWLEPGQGLPDATPFVIVGVCLLVVGYLICELRSLRGSVDDLLIRTP